MGQRESTARDMRCKSACCLRLLNYSILSVYEPRLSELGESTFQSRQIELFSYAQHTLRNRKAGRGTFIRNNKAQTQQPLDRVFQSIYRW